MWLEEHAINMTVPSLKQTWTLKRCHPQIHNIFPSAIVLKVAGSFRECAPSNLTCHGIWYHFGLWTVPTPFRQVAGVFEGDEIVSVNGEPAASLGSQKDRFTVSWKLPLENNSVCQIGFSMLIYKTVFDENWEGEVLSFCKVKSDHQLISIR